MRNELGTILTGTAHFNSSTAGFIVNDDYMIHMRALIKAIYQCIGSGLSPRRKLSLQSTTTGLAIWPFNCLRSSGSLPVWRDTWRTKEELCLTAHHRSFLFQYGWYARYYTIRRQLRVYRIICVIEQYFQMNLPQLNIFSCFFWRSASSKMKCNIPLASVVAGLIGSTCASILTRVGTLREPEISISRRDALAYKAYTIDQPVCWSFKFVIRKFWCLCVDWSFSKWSSVCSTYECHIQTKIFLRCNVL